MARVDLGFKFCSYGKGWVVQVRSKRRLVGYFRVLGQMFEGAALTFTGPLERLEGRRRCLGHRYG